MGFYDWDRMKEEEITDLYRRKVAIGESITIAKVEVKAGAITHPHKHENEEMILVLKGKWRFHLPTGDVTIAPNQLLTIPKGVEHSSEALEDTVALDICAPARFDWSMEETELFTLILTSRSGLYNMEKRRDIFRV